MIIKKSAWLMLIIACLVRWSTAGTCVRIEGAPDADIHITTCENAPHLQYSFTENYMTVSALLESCINSDATGTSSSSVYFNKLHYMEEQYQHTFEYTMMATDVDSHCVVSLIAGEPRNLTDQNGLSNDPLEETSKFALNQWYTRKFHLNNATFDGSTRYIRVGLTCATSTPIANNATTQSLLIRDIRFVSSSYYSPVKVIYNYQLCATGCELTSIDGAHCMPRGDGSATWTYPNDLVNPIVKTAAPLVVLGDVKTSSMWIASSLNITGCLKSTDNTGVTVHLAPSRNITIYHQVGCILPRLHFEIDINPEYSGVPISSPYSSSCLHRFYPENVVVTMDLDQVSFFAGSNTVYEECHNDWNAESKSYSKLATILAVVFSVVGAVGIFLGVFFGVRKYQQQRRKKSLTGVEVPME